MNQESYNSMMSDFEYKLKLNDIKTKLCPCCNLEYMGNGVDLCVVCENANLEKRRSEK